MCHDSTANTCPYSQGRNQYKQRSKDKREESSQVIESPRYDYFIIAIVIPFVQPRYRYSFQTRPLLLVLLYVNIKISDATSYHRSIDHSELDRPMLEARVQPFRGWSATEQLPLSICSILITNDGSPLANRAVNRERMHACIPSAFRDRESFMSCCKCASFVDDKAEVAFVFLDTGLRSDCVRGRDLKSLPAFAPSFLSHPCALLSFYYCTFMTSRAGLLHVLHD